MDNNIIENTKDEKMNDRMLSFILDYLETETRSTSELIRKLIDNVTDLAKTYTISPTRKEIFEYLKTIETNDNKNLQSMLEAMKNHEKDNNEYRKESQKIADKIKESIDKESKEKSEEVKKLIIEQLTIISNTHNINIDKLMNKISSLNTYIYLLIIGVVLLAGFITFMLIYFKSTGQL